MKPKLAVDMDEVVADTAPVHLAAYNTLFSENLTTEILIGRSIYDAIPENHRVQTRDIMREKGFFLKPKPMPGSIDAITKLSTKFEIFVATAAMEFPTSFSEKFQWLRKHFPMIPPNNFVFCGDKKIIAANFLVDDSPRHFANFKGQGILFSALHNHGETHKPRVDSWQSLLDYLL